MNGSNHKTVLMAGVLPRRGLVVPLVPRPSGFWRCPVAGCCFAALNPIEHPCPLPAAASAPGGGVWQLPPVPAEADPVDPAVLGRVLTGLRGLGEAPTCRPEASAEDLGAALAPLERSADMVHALSLPVAGVGA